MPKKTLKLITDSDDDRPIYVAGSFNEWSAGDERYQMASSDLPNQYEYTFDFPDDISHIEYKYTRGGWEGVELGRFNESAMNHGRHVADDWSTPDRVSNWANAGLHYRPELLPKIVVINEEFEIPQLIRTRRVAALLPHNYYESDRHYPVLYLQDGQNLFDDNAPYGSWGVDKQLASMAGRGQGDIIIVAIDHADAQRVSEFTPTFKTKLGRGDGSDYSRFLAKTLKPYIDDHFRTLPGPEHTGIGGSSLGGLISIYAGILYPQVYDRLMIFSPSLWVTPEIPFHLTKVTHKFRGRIYLYGGEAESKTMVPNLHRLQKGLTKQSESDKVVFRLEVDPHGQHNEARWGQEFPKAIEWLFFSDVAVTAP
ncbi:alpha/beta hydrolase-fold protein [Neolewinella persica]|uniref:alpha/beta hydrolase-fold protein n=1 Tax=Neolewinella persica TaxID=70998 RepID=UPI0003670694|nr:alpha/beta hydrolase-fold protein [Neolewinella persica]